MEHEPTTDETLVERARQAADGDRRAFETLVERHTAKVVTNCRYISRSPADAEDLAQEVFVKAFFGLRRFRGGAKFRTWLQRIKVNHCLDHLRKVQGRGFVELEEIPVEPSSPPEVEGRYRSRDKRERIGFVLDQMTDTLRVPLIMRDMDEYSYQEIADALGLGLSAVKMRIKRAREEFRRLYAEIDSTPEQDDA